MFKYEVLINFWNKLIEVIILESKWVIKLLTKTKYLLKAEKPNNHSHKWKSLHKTWVAKNKWFKNSKIWMGNNSNKWWTNNRCFKCSNSNRWWVRWTQIKCKCNSKWKCSSSNTLSKWDKSNNKSTTSTLSRLTSSWCQTSSKLRLECRIIR